MKEAGWTVHKKVNNAYDSGDIFELFDVIAVKKGEKPVYIQVKSNGTQGALKAISEAEFIDPEYINAQVWSIYDRKGWRIHKLSEDGWSIELDERDKDCNIGQSVVELYESS